MGEVWAVEAIALNFLMELSLPDCSMSFGEIRFLKQDHVNDSDFGLAILKVCLCLSKYFFLKIKKYLNKNRHFMYQTLTSESQNNSTTCINLMQTVRRLDMWVAPNMNSITNTGYDG